MQSEPPAPPAQPPINGTLWVVGPGERVVQTALKMRKTYFNNIFVISRILVRARNK